MSAFLDACHTLLERVSSFDREFEAIVEECASEHTRRGSCKDPSPRALLRLNMRLQYLDRLAATASPEDRRQGEILLAHVRKRYLESFALALIKRGIRIEPLTRSAQAA